MLFAANFLAGDPLIFTKIYNGELFVDFEVGGILYKYVLEITDGKIAYESLHYKSSKSYSYLFVRTVCDGQNVNKIQYKHLGVARRELKFVGDDKSLIYAAVQQGSCVAKKIASGFLSISDMKYVSLQSDILPVQVLCAAEIFYVCEKIKN